MSKADENIPLVEIRRFYKCDVCGLQKPTSNERHNKVGDTFPCLCGNFMSYHEEKENSVSKLNKELLAKK